jgi:predicted nucleic acid-binding protein
VAEKTLIDTGPLIAFLSFTDEHHGWAVEQFGRQHPPFFTCEAVLSEAQLLLARCDADPLTVLELVQRGVLDLAFNVADEVERLLQLQRSYRDLPMSLAHACLVRMTELSECSRVFTTDSHFRIFRRNRRQVIPLLAPT